MDPQQKTVGDRLPWVDVLRGVAVLLVLGRHLPMRNLGSSEPLLYPLTLWKQVGWAGVDLFFVISGFLVSGILFKEYKQTQHIRISRFFIRRSIRTIFPFYVFLLLSAPFHLKFINPHSILVEMFFLQSYSDGGTIWGHTWSLAVEEHFYLILGCLLFILSKQARGTNPFKLILPLWFVLGLGCLFMRVLSPFDSFQVFFNSHMRFDGLFFGVLISYFYHFHYDRLKKGVSRSRYLIAPLSALLISPIFFIQAGAEPWMTRFGLTCTYLGFGGILALCLFKETTPPKLIVSVGRISYSTYLWHIAMYETSLHLLNKYTYCIIGLWMAGILYAFLAITMGWLFYRLVEKPSLIWRDKLFPAN